MEDALRTLYPLRQVQFEGVGLLFDGVDVVAIRYARGLSLVRHVQQEAVIDTILARVTRHVVVDTKAKLKITWKKIQSNLDIEVVQTIFTSSNYPKCTLKTLSRYCKVMKHFSFVKWWVKDRLRTIQFSN